MDLLLDNDILGEISLLHEAENQPPHKIDENMWKNREHMEEILFLLEKSHWPIEVLLKEFEICHVCNCKILGRHPILCIHLHLVV